VGAVGLRCCSLRSTRPIGSAAAHSGRVGLCRCGPSQRVDLSSRRRSRGRVPHPPADRKRRAVAVRQRLRPSVVVSQLRSLIPLPPSLSDPSYRHNAAELPGSAKTGAEGAEVEADSVGGDRKGGRAAGEENKKPVGSRRHDSCATTSWKASARASVAVAVEQLSRSTRSARRTLRRPVVLSGSPPLLSWTEPAADTDCRTANQHTPGRSSPRSDSTLSFHFTFCRVAFCFSLLLLFYRSTLPIFLCPFPTRPCLFFCFFFSSHNRCWSARREFVRGSGLRALHSAFTIRHRRAARIGGAAQSDRLGSDRRSDRFSTDAAPSLHTRRGAGGSDRRKGVTRALGLQRRDRLRRLRGWTNS